MKTAMLCLIPTWLACVLANNAAAAERTPTDVQQLADELSVLIEQGAASNSADRRFLDQLRDFVADYDRPWTKTLLDDSFQDGNFTQAPPWSIVTGSFRIDRRGGLIATPSSNRQRAGGGSKDLAAALIGQLLQQNRSDTSRPNATAYLQTPLTSTNAFAVHVEISGMGQNTQGEVALLQGQTGKNGYALVFDNGQGLILERLSAQGRTVIGRFDGQLARGASGRLTLEWTRGRNGRMRIKQNGATALQTVDRGLRDGFNRVRLGSRGGETGFSRIAVNSAP